MKIEVSLSRATINEKKEIESKLAVTDQLGLSFKVDNGKEYCESVIVHELSEPRWTDVFSLTLMNESEILFFQIILNDKNTNSIRVLDSFDLRGNEISNGLDPNKNY